MLASAPRLSLGFAITARRVSPCRWHRTPPIFLETAVLLFPPNVTTCGVYLRQEGSLRCHSGIQIVFNLNRYFIMDFF